MGGLLSKIKKFFQRIGVIKQSYTQPYSDNYSTYPSEGLTPQKLAEIFKEADSGEVLRQMELFEEMEEKDTHLFSQLQTRKNAVTGLDFEIIPFSDSEKDKEIAEFVNTKIQNIEDFDEYLMDLMDAVGKGIAFVEIVWEFTKDGFGVKALKRLHQKHFYWNQDDILCIRTKENMSGEPVKKNKLIIHKYKAKSGHPARAGLLRICAWMYLFKNYDIKDWVTFCEVYGLPLRLGTYPADAKEEEKAALMQALVSLGTDAAGIVPEGADIKIIESNKQSSIDLYEKLARFCDEQMSKCILGQTLTSDSGGGSYAQSKTHNEVRHDLTMADCKALSATLRRDLLTPLVKFNFGEEAHVPYLKFDCEEGEDLEKTIDMYDKLINKLGLKVSTNHIYKKFNIPKPEDNEEIAAGETVMPSAQSSMIANKLQFQGKQAEVDDLVEIAKLESVPAFKKQFNVLKESINKCKSLEEIKEILEDDKAVMQICKGMQDSKFEQFLRGSLLNAYLMGRSKEDE